jgi:non-heme chloroperoxidase
MAFHAFHSSSFPPRVPRAAKLIFRGLWIAERDCGVKDKRGVDVSKASRFALFIAIGSLCGFHLVAQQDKSPHKAQLVTAEEGIQLEVLDWGGSGSPMVFLGGSDAHVFDDFAPKFTESHHVYGISQQGFGKSSAPEPTTKNYTSDHLADGVLAVISRLNINRPVLVGHSQAGEILSSIGSRDPQRVTGLIYLDGGYAYAFYSPTIGDIAIDAVDEQHKLDLFLAKGFQNPQQIDELKTGAARLRRDLERIERTISLQPPRPSDSPPIPPIGLALSRGHQKYTHIDVPVLAIYADPHSFGPLYRNDPDKLAALVADDKATVSAQVDAFQAGVPSAQVIRIPNADHFIFRSNEAEVIRDMNAFIAKLPGQHAADDK